VEKSPPIVDANQSSTQTSMLIVTCIYLVAGLFFVFSATGLKKDLAAQS